MNSPPREVCLRCRRPRVVCYCDRLVPRETGTRVVFLQHPREAKVAIGTARMAHLALPNSELHTGVVFSDSPRVQELAASEDTALLFPGEGAEPPERWSGRLRHLVVIDGTWAQARQVLRRNPLLQQLPRIGLKPAAPGNYRIRREPTPESLATIEAVVEVLGSLEQDRATFEVLLEAFRFMVDRQVEYASRSTASPRHWAPSEHRNRRVEALRAALESAVVVHGEVNAHSRGHGPPGEPELLQLVACRVRTGETFEAIVRPRRPLGVLTAQHLGLEEASLLGGEDVEGALDRWQSWLAPGDVPCGWGPFTRDLLAREGAPLERFMDLRMLVAQQLQRSPGSPHDAAQALHASLGALRLHGRAGAMVAAMAGAIQPLAVQLSGSRQVRSR